MDLKDFISTTLISIKEGLAEANSKTDKAFKIAPESKVINFNVAVEVSNEGTTQKGGGMRIHVVEAKLGKETKEISSNISRIDFTVGVNTIIT